VNYHRWLTRADFATKFAPTPQEAKTVEEFFVSHNLRVVTVGQNNVFVRAEGTVANVEKAFQVKINNFEVNGKIYRANTTESLCRQPGGGAGSVCFRTDEPQI
jgi:subtilase family serine protease